MISSRAHLSRAGRPLLTATVALLIAVATAALGDTVRLKDGSVINGKVVSFANDTLLFETSFGSTARIHRSRVVAIQFGEGAVSTVVDQQSPEVLSEAGKLEITFKDRAVSSKITVEHKRDYDEAQRANAIVEALIVDGNTVYSLADTVTDKTIYNGTERSFKNEMALEDILVDVKAGVHDVVLMVSNKNMGDFSTHFDPEPLRIEFAMANTAIYAGKTTRVLVGLTRGRLGMGKPRFYRVD